MSCSSKEIGELVINIMIKPYCSKGMTKGEDIKKVLRDQVVFTPICKLNLFLEVGDS